MLTRLEVDGFKNLHHLDVRFGPFTCIAGLNGVGKSNVFDAIAFLAALAEKPLIEAAMGVRGAEARRGDVRALFRRSGGSTVDRMRFGVEFLIPETGEDDLGQPARASMTFLRYDLEIRLRDQPAPGGIVGLEIVSEKMGHIRKSEARKCLGFDASREWRESVVRGRRTSPYISTSADSGAPVVSLHADSSGEMGGGRPRQVPASSLPRTMLSSVNNAAEHRTLVLARKEMMSWTQVQLEPSALRAPDSFTAPRTVGLQGAHLPATLHALVQAADARRAAGDSSAESGADVLTRIANRLSELVEDVRRVEVDVDEKRQLLSIVITDHRGTEHVAGALSDGTLRFLALAVMEADPRSRRLLCLEEPENGIHPRRIPSVIQLLRDLAVDPEVAVCDDNPLRQVIVNTHSPSVVQGVQEDELLVASGERTSSASGVETRLSIRCLSDTWRAAPDAAGCMARADVLAYLDPAASLRAAAPHGAGGRGARRRVLERSDLLPLFAPSSGVAEE